MLSPENQHLAMLYSIIVGLFVFIVVVSLSFAHKNDVERNRVADCVWSNMEQDSFLGNYQEGWMVYSNVCQK